MNRLLFRITVFQMQICTLLLTMLAASAVIAVHPTWESEVPYGMALGGLADTQSWRLIGNSVYVANNRTLSNLDAQTGVTKWTREVGANPTFRLMQDGGVVTLSFSISATSGTATSTPVLTRFAPTGTVLWSFTISTPTGSFATLVRADSPSSAVAVEFGNSLGTVAVFDQTGAELWRRAGRSGCLMGATGAMLCASNNSMRLIARTDGAIVVERTYTGVESGYQPKLLANADGSFTVGRETVGFNAQRWLANGTVAATFVLPTAKSKWVFRTNGGAFAYQFDNAYQPGSGADTAYVSSFGLAGEIEWQSSYPETSYYTQFLATADALYFGRYWRGMTRVDRNGATKVESFPVSLSEAALVGNDFLWATGGPLVLQRADATLVWSKQEFELSDNAGSYGCEPQLYDNDQSVVVTRQVAQNTAAVLDLFDRGTGAISTVNTPQTQDVNQHDSYALGVQHCRTAVDASRNVFQVIATKAADASISWVVRVTDPAGNVIRESASVPLPTLDTGIRVRDAQVMRDGSYYVQVNDTLSQFSVTGQKLWIVNLPNVGFGNAPVSILRDVSGGLFVYSGSFSGKFLRRYSGAGVLLWDTPTSNFIRTWRLAPDGGLFVVYTGSGVDTIEKLSSAGQSVWANTLVLSGGTTAFPQFSHLANLPADGVLAAGCYTINNTQKLAMVVGFSGTGNRLFFTTLPGTSPAFDTCVSAVTSLSDQSVLVAVNQTYWASFSVPIPAWSTGTFRLKASGELANTWLDLDRTALRTRGGWSLMVAEPGDFVVQAGRFSQRSSYFMTAAARKWKVPLQARSMSTTIAGTQYQFGEILPFRFTLKDESGIVQVATESKSIWLQPADATPADGPGAVVACTIVVAASYCDNVAVRAQKVGSSQIFAVLADGVAPSQTPAVDVAQASVNLMARILDLPPYRALATVVVEFTVSPAALPVGQSLTVANLQYWNAPSVTLGSGLNTCQRTSAVGVFPSVFTCTVTLNIPNTSVTAAASASQLTLASGNATVNITPVSPGNPVIYLERLWPSNPAPLGRPFEPVVSLRIAGKKIVGQVPSGALVLGLGNQTCIAKAVVVSTPLGPYDTGDYSCAISPTVTGNLNFAAQFSGSAALNSASAPSLGSVNVLSVTGFFADHASAQAQSVPVRVCSPTPGLTCEVSPFGDQSFCAAAQGWQGSLYLQATNDTEFRLAAPPPVVTTPTALVAASVQMPALTARPASLGACFLDIDRDGYISAERDGLALLRGLLGFTGSALTTGLIHPCSGRTDAVEIARHIGQQSVVGAYDVDLDGHAQSTTDALIVARYLLGLRGDALVAGLPFPPSAQRNSAAALAGYLQSVCGL